MFSLNDALLTKSQATLSQWPDILWLIGGSCSGKSTVARALAGRTGRPLYDMDEAMFGRFRFDPIRHPATTAWFTADNPLGWMLALSWPEFDALYRASNAEMLDLLAGDLAGRPPAPLILDGGITHPSVLTQVIPAPRVVCLETSEARRVREWETAAGRAEMRAAVLALPDGPAMWARFLEYDRRLTATLGRESRAAGIRVLSWDETTTVEMVCREIQEEIADSAD